MALIDPRVIKQAQILTDYSVKIKKGENVVIVSDFLAKPLVFELYRLLIKRGAREVKIHFGNYELSEIFYKNAAVAQIEHFPVIDEFEMRNCQCYIAISSSSNTRGLTGIDADKMAMRSKVLRPLIDYRVEKTKWVITRFPSEAQAQEADMSLSDYEDFVFDAINKVDWKKKYKEQEKLCDLVNKTKEVRIIGSGTDLHLNISGRKAVNAAGEFNMPDGEVFTSVVEDSASGYIQYSYPAIYMGREFHNVRLEFNKGKVIKATASKNEDDLNKILNMDTGSRSIGELGLGNNYKIQKFTKDILFDEKLGGSIHIALGKGYKETLSKNISALHWDMIKDLRKPASAESSTRQGGSAHYVTHSVAGGELWFDDKLVQKDGKWQGKY